MTLGVLSSKMLMLQPDSVALVQGVDSGVSKRARNEFTFPSVQNVAGTNLL